MPAMQYVVTIWARNGDELPLNQSETRRVAATYHNVVAESAYGAAAYVAGMIGLHPNEWMDILTFRPPFVFRVEEGSTLTRIAGPPEVIVERYGDNPSSALAEALEAAKTFGPKR